MNEKNRERERERERELEKEKKNKRKLKRISARANNLIRKSSLIYKIIMRAIYTLSPSL